MRPTDAIGQAEDAVREELDALVDELGALAERAKGARADAKRLTALSERGEALEKELRTTHERLTSAGVHHRPPDGANGEAVDEELAERVKAERENGRKPAGATP